MTTPFFPPWRSRFAALGRRWTQLRQQPLPVLQTFFGSFLPPDLLCPTEQGPNSRQRVFSLRRTFWLFLWQVLNPGSSCRQAVRQLQALLILHNQGSIAEDTGAYCQARVRLPLATLQKARQAATDQSQRRLPEAQRYWLGWEPLAVDGSTLSMPDTVKNQKAYPQLSSQTKGCGFPLMKIVGLFALGSGALLHYAKGNKHSSEQSLFHSLWVKLQPKQLLLGDRGFCNYVTLALLPLQRQVACVFRLHQARNADFRKGRRLAKHDRLFVWQRPWAKTPWLSEKLWAQVPKELTVRVLRFTVSIPGFRSRRITLVTTLLDAKAYPPAALAQLYRQRWQMELWWRDIKTSMGAEVLRCQTPEMVHKELELYLLAYNLMRALMVEAGALYDCPIDRISFKGTVDAARQFSQSMAQARSQKKRQQLETELLAILARDQVPERPNRKEPRALKRRPKSYPYLNRPRQRFKEIAHRSRYRAPVTSLS